MAMQKRAALGIGTALLLGIGSGLVSCGGHSSPTSSGGSDPVGSITINPEPNAINAPWTLDGPGGLTRQGTGDRTLADMAVGDYTLNWGAVDGWTTPSASQETKSLASGGTITFGGTYVELGSIAIDAEPNAISAPWTLDGPDGFSQQGAGDQTLVHLAAGDYTVTWGAVDGWTTPDVSPETQSLANESTITFGGTYVEEVALTGWYPSPSPPPGTITHLFALEFLDSNIGVVTGTQGAIRTTVDGGLNWTSVPVPTADTWGWWGVNLHNPTSITVVGSTPEGYGRIAHTNDGGATWTLATINPTSRINAVDFSGEFGMAVGSAAEVLYSTNGGVDWIERPRNLDVNFFKKGIVAHDANTFTVIGDGGSVLRTADAGVTWTRQTTETGQNLYGVSFADATHGLVVGAGGTILQTSDGGATWIHRDSGTTQALNGVSYAGTGKATIVGFAGLILRSVDGGTTWTPQESGTTKSLHDVLFVDENVGFAVGEYETILRTDDGGG